MSMPKPKVTARRARPSTPRAIGRTGKRSHFAAAFEIDPISRVVAIRKGVSSAELVRTSRAMGLPKERIYRMLRLPASTSKRKLAQQASFPPEQSERILGLQRLIGQVEVMVAESGAGGQPFDAGAWIARWLDQPSPALGNKAPGEFLDTIAGQEIIATLLAQMQSGAYA